MSEQVLPAAVADSIRRRLAPRPDPYFNDPVRWAHDKLNVDLWSLQREAAMGVVDARRGAVQACHGVGKSFLAAVLIAWWVSTRPIEDLFVVWTAPRWPQVKAVIGRELRRVLAALDNGITLNENMELKAPDGRLIGYGRKPADRDEHGFQGIHALHVLVVLDEACGIPPALWTAAKALATNENARIFAIGNPDDPETEFRNVCSPASGWKTTHISALASPNFTGERVSTIVKNSLVSRLWVEEAKRDWGVDSPIYQSKVLGVFPETSEAAVFTPAMILAAQNRDLTHLEGDTKGCFGFDIGGMGGDESVGYRNRNGVVRRVLSLRGERVDVVQQKIADAMWGPTGGVYGTPAWIDAVGIGQGVFDNLLAVGYPVLEYKGGARARRPDRYVNLRAETIWDARLLFQAELVDIDPEDLTLAAQLQALRYEEVEGRRIKIEGKDDLAKRRGGAMLDASGGERWTSPDRADAATMALYPPPVVELPDVPAVPRLTGGLLRREL